ncbi:hypothetical protein GGR88_002007 [Sphingomonas jejuensis]|uniref:DUF4167 domain-containing protein n=1 Tax=Sphingomonas jejuensis TaxID=904715 RepID=A0ABX0XMS3_9SPHN|nr:DUF4167 domain-containing protein [Sphingomonas jejuensis]NJC34493.1 hypothetical protein [Sphingomonas jejuensis]
MINNRQAGRRRGRGGQQRPQGGRPEQGNRIDNRARGNASQLLEKYRNLASDAQRQGDRVTTEYYLQFADHYFRVLSESRPRAEDQPQRRQRDDFDDDADGDMMEDVRAEGARDDDRERGRFDREQRGDRDQRQDRERPERDGRSDRGDREDRADRDGRPQREPRADAGFEPRRERRARAPEMTDEQQPVATDAEAGETAGAEAVERPRRGRRPRQREEAVEQQADQDASGAGDPLGFADRLPPAIAPVPAAADGEEAAAPRRRTRRPRAEANDDGSIAAA